MLYQYKIDRFLGIDQSCDENILHPSFSPDAVNMNTDDGNLSVAKGFVRHIIAQVPGEGDIHRLVIFKRKEGDIFLVFCSDAIYASTNGLWVKAYEFTPALEDYEFDTVEVSINNTDYLLIANGETQMLKYDGDSFYSFGSAENQSDIPVRYLALYKNRLFSAGNKDYPNRLYYSKLPGGNRSIEDWGYDEASPNVEGGHIEVGDFDSDPIIALTALSSQLLIFKKHSIYRLYGDKPSNFVLEQVEADSEYVSHTSIVHYSDVAYYFTNSGLNVLDGVNARLSSDAMKIKNIMNGANTRNTRGVRAKNKLYFTIKKGSNTELIEYDLNRRTYMRRNGFEVIDMVQKDNIVFFINSSRHICRLDYGNTYAGEPIVAYWRTPITDLGEKSTIKQFDELYLRGSGTSLSLTTYTGGFEREHIITNLNDEVAEVPLIDEGRTIGLKIANSEGSSFQIKGGMELHLKVRGRCK